MRNLKRVLSLALALVMVLGMMVITTSAADYADADEITYTEAVAVLTGVGLFEGDGSNFNPGKVLTRREAATLVTRILLGDKIAASLTPTKQIFTDVPTDKWGAAAIEYCYNIGMIIGNGDGTFNPDGPLTGTAFAKLLLCALGYDAGSAGYTGSNWAQSVKADALANNLLIEDVTISEELTREQAAQMILQVLDSKMVRYYDSYDYATGAHTVLGPVPVDKTFKQNYYSTLTKETNEYAMWGRPYEYVWYFEGAEIYSVMKTPVKTYTEFVTECDIAEDLGLKANATISKFTWNNVDVTKTKVVDNKVVAADQIELLATKNGYGAQGCLFEIYKKGSSYEFVMIDTFLAQVTDVEDRTYDRNNHVDDPAELHLGVYGGVTSDLNDYTEMVLTSKTADYDYKAGEWLLVYVDESEWFKSDEVEDLVPYIQGAPETLTGAQTAWTYNDETHEVEDEVYNDACRFYLDQTERLDTDDYIWFFDFYGNLIGAIEPAEAPSTYGVISSIYWRDSRDGETGYAYAKITYLDGTSEWKVVSSINGVTLEGVEGKNAEINIVVDDPATEKDESKDSFMLVSSTKQYNKTTFTNKALYEINSGKDGLKLTDTTFVEGGQLTTNKKTVVEDEVYVNSKTMFLVYNSKKDTYSAYVGIRNLPEYVNPEINLWVAEVIEGEDTNAEYVFVVDPQTKETEAEVDMVVVLTDDTMKMKANLEDDTIVSYKFSNILVDGETDAVVFDAADEDLMAEFLDNMDIPMVLEITDGVVTDVLTSDKHREVNEKPAEYFGKVGALGTDCEYEADDESLYVNGEWYDVADAKLIGARNWKTAIAAGMNVAVVYDADLAVSFVYFYEA